MKAKLAKASGDSDAVLVSGVEVGEEVRLEDIKTLQGRGWLNDVIVNAYLRLISRRCLQSSEMPKVWALSSFFYTRYTKSGYSSVERWTKKVDLFSLDILFVPIHDARKQHWSLVVSLMGLLPWLWLQLFDALDYGVIAFVVVDVVVVALVGRFSEQENHAL